jgi:trimethylamine--corrinoid protein Co-methyltransferase
MMAEVGPGGHHLGTAHTQARYRTEFYASFLSDRQNHDAWQQSGVGDTAARAHELWKKLLAAYETPPLDIALRDALKDFVARRQRELAGVELYS